MAGAWAKPHRSTERSTELTPKAHDEVLRRSQDAQSGFRIGSKTFLLCGATGALTARLAAQQGLRPILAGRNPATVKALADELHLEGRAFALCDTVALHAALKQVSVVLHCAGPYSRTYRPMVEACLATGTHYLDITGEIMSSRSKLKASRFGVYNQDTKPLKITD